MNTGDVGVSLRMRGGVTHGSPLVAYADDSGVWLSWLERIHDTDEVGGSIPSTPTSYQVTGPLWAPLRHVTGGLGQQDPHRGRAQMEQFEEDLRDFVADWMLKEQAKHTVENVLHVPPAVREVGGR